jgi:hypothetical protein
VLDYECEILETNRVYDNDGEDALGQGFFILELAVEQVVYVTTTAAAAAPLSTAEIVKIVETGFNIGTGGRVKFRSLLREAAELSSVVDVGVLDGGLSSPEAAPSFRPSVSTIPSTTPSLDISGAPSVVPSFTPTSAPSITPTQIPSGSPSYGPTSVASKSPSLAPLANMTHRPAPSLDYTAKPTSGPAPSLDYTAEPTSGPTPSLVPTAQPTSLPNIPLSSTDDNDRKPLIVGAIAGGVATIMVSCFFIFCVYFPFCGRKASHEEEGSADGFRPGNRRFHNGRDSSEPSSSKEKPFIPNTVQLDDENESLANTTLGDQTAGGVFGSQLTPRIKNAGDGGPKIKNAGDGSAIRMFDSFDESSLYTSPHVTPCNAAETNTTSLFSAEPSTSSDSAAMVLPPSLSRPLDFEDDLFFPMSESNTDSSTDGNTLPVSRSRVSTRSGSRVSTRFRPVDVDEGPIDVDTVQFVDDEENEEDSSDSKSSFAGVHTVESDEDSDEDSDESSLSEQCKKRRVYDPCEDGSSGSSSSSKHDDNARDSPVCSGEPEKQDVSPSGHENSGMPRSPGDRANNSLLRNVLEDARRIVDMQSHSSQSRLSRQSAPSRLLSKNSKPITASTVVTPPLDLLADNDMLDGESPIASRGSHWSAKSSTRSVGAVPRSSTMKKYEDRHVDFEKPVSTTHSEANPPYRTRFLDRVAMMTTRNFIPTSEEEEKEGDVATPGPSRSVTGIFDEAQEAESSTPASSAPSSKQEDCSSTLGAQPRNVAEPSTPDWSSTLGAQPRNEQWDTLAGESKLPDTPDSSPGMLGIIIPPTKKAMPLDDASSDSSGFSNPWLFDSIEQTLGPRSRDADMESIGGHSTLSGKSHKSTRSGKSYKSSRSSKSSASSPSGASIDAFRSHRSATSLRTHKSERMRRAGNSPSSKPARAASLINGSVGEQKSDSVEPMIPRTLETDLKRLEMHMHLSDVLQSETDKIAASSITVSSVGASTLSSKQHFAKRSKKKRLVVVVPPGKLGVVLANRHDGRGTVISEVRASSSMSGMLSPGDKLGKNSL